MCVVVSLGLYVDHVRLSRVCVSTQAELRKVAAIAKYSARLLYNCLHKETS